MNSFDTVLTLGGILPSVRRAKLELGGGRGGGEGGLRLARLPTRSFEVLSQNTEQSTDT